MAFIITLDKNIAKTNTWPLRMLVFRPWSQLSPKYWEQILLQEQFVENFNSKPLYHRTTLKLLSQISIKWVSVIILKQHILNNLVTLATYTVAVCGSALS